MDKWEYMTLDSSSNYGTTKFYINGDMQPALKNEPLHKIINQIGGQGWELIGISSEGPEKTYIFKRPSARKSSNGS